MAPVKVNNPMPTLKTRFFLPLVTVMLFAGLTACASTGRLAPPDPAVVGITRSMPAGDTVAEDALCARLVQMGPTAIVDLGRMLVARPDTSDDSGARFALSALSRYVGRPGAESERSMFATALLQALEERSDPDVKAFLMSQLQLAGGDESVGALGTYLDDDRLCEPATRALISIGTPAAEAALIDALPRTDGGNTVTLVRALGELRSRAALFEIWKYTAADDRDLRDAVLYALSNIGPVSTGDLLAEAAGGRDRYERGTAIRYQLVYAERLAEAGRRDEGMALCRRIAEEYSGQGQESTRIAALTTLVGIAGGASQIDLYMAVRDPSIEIRRAALNLAGEMPGEEASLIWLNMLQRADWTLRNDLREMLRDRARVWPTAQLEKAIAEWDEEKARIAWAATDEVDLTDEGFTTLFNGEDLTGWTGDTIGYVAEEGAIVVDPERRGGGGNLYTVDEYDDFVLRFQFRLTSGANNGLGIRAPLEGDAAYVGMELQILDNSSEQYAELQPYQYHGSVYGVAPAERGWQKPVGEWNTQEVIADGRSITVILNGHVIVEADLDEASSPETLDHRNHPGLARSTGHIGFLGHGSRVEFRNIWIKPIDR